MYSTLLSLSSTSPSLSFWSCSSTDSSSTRIPTVTDPDIFLFLDNFESSSSFRSTGGYPNVHEESVTTSDVGGVRDFCLFIMKQ